MGGPKVRKAIVTLALLLYANHALSQVGAVTKAIRGAEAASEAANAARAAKAGTKVIAAEGTATALTGSEKIISNETKALIAARTAQVVSKCKSSDILSMRYFCILASKYLNGTARDLLYIPDSDGLVV